MKKALIISGVMLSFAVPGSAHAAISFIGAASSTATTITIPAHQTGDLILMSAERSNAALCTVPAGWTTASTTSVSGFSTILAYKFATSDADTSGTWTNCTRLMDAIYRDASSTRPFGTVATTTGSSATMTYTGITLQETGGTSWVVAIGLHLAASTNGGNVTPAGMTTRIFTVGAPREGIHDSNGGTSSFTSKNTTASGSGAWATYSIEILAGSATDSVPPVPGNSGALSLTSVHDTDLNIGWSAGTDDVTSQSLLSYRVFMSTSNNIDTVAHAEANGTPLTDWTANMTSHTVTGLTPSTQYYFNVLITDGAGNEAAYTMANATTQSTCSHQILSDFTGGTSGTQISAAALDAGTYGITGSNWAIEGATANFIFDNNAYHPLYGRIPHFCDAPWPGETTNGGISLLIDNSFHSARFDYPSNVASTVTIGYWFKSDYPPSQSGVNIDSADVKNGATYVNVPFQVTNGSQTIGMETDTGCSPGVTSSSVKVTAGNWYWVTLQYTTSDQTNKGIREAVFDQNMVKIKDYPGDERFTSCTTNKAAYTRFGHQAVTSGFNLPGSRLYYDKYKACYIGDCPFPVLPDFSLQLSLWGMLKLAGMMVIK